MNYMNRFLLVLSFLVFLSCSNKVRNSNENIDNHFFFSQKAFKDQTPLIFDSIYVRTKTVEWETSHTWYTAYVFENNGRVKIYVGLDKKPSGLKDLISKSYFESRFRIEDEYIYMEYLQIRDFGTNHILKKGKLNPGNIALEEVYRIDKKGKILGKIKKVNETLIYVGVLPN